MYPYLLLSRMLLYISAEKGCNVLRPVEVVVARGAGEVVLVYTYNLDLLPMLQSVCYSD